MNARAVTYDDIRQDVKGIVTSTAMGGSVVLDETNQPVAAIISFDDYMALQEQLEDLRDFSERKSPSVHFAWEAEFDRRCDCSFDAHSW